MSKQRKKQSNVLVKSDVKKKKKRKTVHGLPQKNCDRIKTLLTCPDSSLTEINIKTFVNEETFLKLPSYLQYKLITLLPRCDQNICSDGRLTLSEEAFSNEFFTKACEEWRNRLAEGCFTDDRLQHMNIERGRQQAGDSWKIKYFESTVPKENTLSCPALPSLATTASATPSRKRKFEVDDNVDLGNSLGKRTKADKTGENVKIKQTECSEVATNNHQSHQDGDEEANSKLKMRDSRMDVAGKNGRLDRKLLVTKKLNKTCVAKKKNGTQSIGVTERSVDVAGSEASLADVKRAGKQERIKADLKTSPDCSSPVGSTQKLCNSQDVKSKILHHLNDKLEKNEKQLESRRDCKDGREGCRPQQLCRRSDSGDGTLTLSDLISREFELVSNCSATEAAPSFLKFEHLKFGFYGSKTFRCELASSDSPVSPTSPSLCRLAGLNDSQLKVSSQEFNSAQVVQQTNFCKEESNKLSPSPPAKQRQTNFVGGRSERPLAEYFPLLSSSLKNAGKTVGQAASRLKSPGSKRSAHNSVERETLLCLAKKLSQKLLGRTNLVSSISCPLSSVPPVESLASPVVAFAPELLRSAGVSGLEQDRAHEAAVSKIPVTFPSRQQSSLQAANFNRLKDLLSSITSKPRSVATSVHSSEMPDPMTHVLLSFSNCQTPFSREGLDFPDVGLVASATSVDSLPNVVVHPPRPPALSPSSGDLVKKFHDGPDASYASQQNSCMLKLPLPVIQNNLMDQKKKPPGHQELGNLISRISYGSFLRTPLVSQSGVPRTLVHHLPSPLQVRSPSTPLRFPGRTINSPQPLIQMSHVPIDSSKAHLLPSSDYSTPGLQARSHVSLNRLNIHGQPTISDVDDLAALSQKGPNRLDLNSIIQSPQPQLSLTHTDKMVSIHSNDNSVVSRVICNPVINDVDSLKMDGKMSLQIPMSALMSTLRPQSSIPLPQGNLSSPFPPSTNSIIPGTNGSLPLIIFPPLNQQLSLGPYLNSASVLPENPLSKVNSSSSKKVEMPQNNLLQVNQVLLSPQTYLPLLTVGQGSIIPQMSPSTTKNQIILLQNTPASVPGPPKSFNLQSDGTCSSPLKNVTFIPIVNTTTCNNNQLLFLLSPTATNQK